MRAMRAALTRRIGWGKILLLWLGTALYAFSGSRQPTLPLFLLNALSSQYYQVYLVLLLLLICGSVMEDESESVICRFPSFWAYFCTKWRALYGLCILALLGQILLFFLAGMGLPLADTWASYSATGATAEIFSFFSRFFSTPGQVLTAALLWLLIGYGLLAFLILLLGHFLPRTTAIVLLFFFYTLAIFSFKLPFWSRPPFCHLLGLNHWLLLLHSLTRPGQLWRTLVQTLAVVLMGIWAVRRHWQHKWTHAYEMEVPHGKHY